MGTPKQGARLGKTSEKKGSTSPRHGGGTFRSCGSLSQHRTPPKLRRARQPLILHNFTNTNMAASPLGKEVQEPPADGVTALRFSARGLLLASSWDGTARLYDNLVQRGAFSHRVPVLDCCFQDSSESVIFTAGLDAVVKRYDFFSRSEAKVAEHSKAVRCVEYLPDLKLLVTGSWDGTLRIWNPQAPFGQNLVNTLYLPDRVFTMAQSQSRLVIGTAGRQVLIYDLKMLGRSVPVSAEQQRESSLKHQTRCIRCHPDGTGYTLSSIEGRVAVEYFDPGEAAQAAKYAFKCHRRNEGGKEAIFPINSMAFHPVLGTFATGGCDGVVNMWDGKNQKRLCQLTGYPTSIAAMAFSPDGSRLAIASSYTYEHGEVEHAQDSIFIRNMAESEVRPKPRK
ncbi:hypothetical protein WJX74_008502 [Apatococcus lobatus]|uniref:Mitotic checkpoint protein BUB3 n=1 Tax=Apatococcus lobatus TaxID=904363 RepID=A0AAW1RG03_9CHLO